MVGKEMKECKEVKKSLFWYFANVERQVLLVDDDNFIETANLVIKYCTQFLRRVLTANLIQFWSNTILLLFASSWYRIYWPKIKSLLKQNFQQF